MFYLLGKVLAQRWVLPRRQQWPMLKSQNLEQKPFWQILNSQRVVTFTFESAKSCVHNSSFVHGHTSVKLFFLSSHANFVDNSIFTKVQSLSLLSVDCTATHR